MSEQKGSTNSFFKVTVNKDAISKPLLDTNESSSIEIRDPDGNLMVLIILVPGHPVMMVSAADKDPDFKQFCSNMGFELKK
jgi:hypothetical protein